MIDEGTMYMGFDSGKGDKTVLAISSHGSMSAVYPPEWAGDVVDITVYQDVLIVACKRAVFRLRDGVLYPLKFSE